MKDHEEQAKSGIKRRGFASLSPERIKEIASLGGRSVPSEKRSFKDRKLAAAAGSRGGKNVPNHLRSFAVNPELAREAGRKGWANSSDAKRAGTVKGGLASGAARRKKANKSAEPVA